MLNLLQRACHNISELPRGNQIVWLKKAVQREVLKLNTDIKLEKLPSKQELEQPIYDIEELKESYQIEDEDIPNQL